MGNIVRRNSRNNPSIRELILVGDIRREGVATVIEMNAYWLHRYWLPLGENRSHFCEVCGKARRVDTARIEIAFYGVEFPVSELIYIGAVGSVRLRREVFVDNPASVRIAQRVLIAAGKENGEEQESGQ